LREVEKKSKNKGLERRSLGEEEKGRNSRGWSKSEAKARFVLN